MNQNEWGLVVLNSATEHYQVYDETLEVRKPKWLRMLLKALLIGSKLYGL